MNQILDLETAEFVFEYNNYQLPLTFKNFFQKVNIVHSRCTTEIFDKTKSNVLS